MDTIILIPTNAKFLSQPIGLHVYKTLGTSVIYSPLSHCVKMVLSSNPMEKAQSLYLNKAVNFFGKIYLSLHLCNLMKFNAFRLMCQSGG